MQDKPCESSMPMKSNKNSKIVNDVKEHAMKELKKEKGNNEFVVLAE